jgi:DNA-binding NarL/FixJ family response regulator
VLALVAEGLTDAAIAERLVVTRRTVETHLGNAYRKLQIKSRSELPKALEGGVEASAAIG